ncbi:MAG: sn-glycerol-3-phosphate ABC transporter ATP-binding protein UgpC [Nitrospirae bacterium]|nr:MAG: sn-glycerol-3-phosphate ABC transporter ATP-binding protein UgpC [Nitrospirota bacterium]
MASLRLEHISKMFGRTTVLDDISLHAADGEFVVLLGPSGCGKSTLLRIIAGLEQQTSGTVRIGEEIVDALPPRERDIAMVFQQYALYPHLTVRENLAFGLKMRKEPPAVIEARLAEVAKLLEIEDLLDRKPKELSGGQRQRVAMGRAIVRKPKLFLFDEPLSNLDARLRASMRVELKKLHRRLQATIVYVTHDQVEAMTLGDTIVILDQGRIQQIGAPEQIYQEPSNPFVASFIGSPPMNLIEGQIRCVEEGFEFRAGNFVLGLPLRSGEASRLDGKPAILGIRPEDIALSAPPTPSVERPATIDLIENLGADCLVYLIVDGQRLIARASSVPPQQAGETCTVFMSFSKFHVFIDGRRIA